jgi:mono/diheme cytochrome c family protein
MRLDRKTLVVLLLASLLGACARPRPGEAAADLERGRLLYENTCDACHTTQPHWRSARLVKSWPDLLAQVDRWQNVARANWTPADIRDVASYLNAQFYHLPCDACGGPRAAQPGQRVAYGRRK